jgi:hypothetical protein
MIENGAQWFLFITFMVHPMERPLVFDIPTERNFCLEAEISFRATKRLHMPALSTFISPNTVWCYRKLVESGKKDLERKP